MSTLKYIYYSSIYWWSDKVQYWIDLFGGGWGALKIERDNDCQRGRGMNKMLDTKYIPKMEQCKINWNVDF